MTGRIDSLFLDFCGVLYDCGDPLASQWRRLLAEFFVPRLGGDAAAWERASTAALDRAGMWHRAHPPSSRGSVSNYNDEVHVRWVADMCDAAGVQTPTGSERLSLAREATAYVLARIRPTSPDHADQLRRLFGLGYRLHTAGNPSSREIAGYLRALGADHMFRYTYGPDLVNVWKDGPEFYLAIARHAGVEIERAAVVDDDPLYLAAAREAGAAATFLVSSEVGPGPHTIVASLAELADALS